MKPIASLVLSLALAGAAVAYAADPHAGHAGHAGHAMPAATNELSDGTVKKVDATAGKLTIAHGPLKNLGMPPMTMVFKVKDKGLLKGLKDGDAIRFAAEQSGNDYVVTRVQPKK